VALHSVGIAAGFDAWRSGAVARAGVVLRSIYD
jgi:hypothetical protein